MDELSALAPEIPTPVSAKRLSRQHQRRYAGSSASGSVNGHALSINTSITANTNAIEILAPTPRRHLIESSASQHWLRTPPLSESGDDDDDDDDDGSSHYYHSMNTSTSPSQQLRQTQRHRVVSSLSSIPPTASTVRRRRVSNASTGSQTTRKGLPRVSSVGSLRGSTIPPLPSHDDDDTDSDTTLADRLTTLLISVSPPSSTNPSPILPISLLLTLLTLPPLLISLGPYSGYATPPKFGDFEAQRHWLELTLHLPPREWYTHDLEWWGLDYPPLTAYVSWACGVLAHAIEPGWVELGGSKGVEGPGVKVFMRCSVLVLWVGVYVSGVWGYVRTWGAGSGGGRGRGTPTRREIKRQMRGMLCLLMHPALLLIDFGHFQYNCVMLGLTLHTLAHLRTRTPSLSLSALFFVLALSFKQMALYYAPAIGAYLFLLCISLPYPSNLRLFTHLALTTLGAFYVLFLPWLPPLVPLSTLLPSSPTHIKEAGILQVVHRIFPLARGVFEDKVANFWCASNVVFRWKSERWGAVLGGNGLVRLSAVGTVLGFLPGVVVMGRVAWGGRGRGRAGNASKDGDGETKSLDVDLTTPPFLPLLPYALLTSSMSFFLFSFQVHEKTILLPLLPLTLLLVDPNVSVGSATWEWVMLGANVGCFSMFPLLKKDGLSVQYLAVLLLWNRVVGYNPLKYVLNPREAVGSFVRLLSLITHILILLLHTSELLFPPPARYPDLYPVLNVLLCAPVFALIWAWSMKCAVEVGWAVGGVGGRRGGGKREGKRE